MKLVFHYFNYSSQTKGNNTFIVRRVYGNFIASEIKGNFQQSFQAFVYSKDFALEGTFCKQGQLF